MFGLVNEKKKKDKKMMVLEINLGISNIRFKYIENIGSLKLMGEYEEVERRDERQKNNYEKKKNVKLQIIQPNKQTE